MQYNEKQMEALGILQEECAEVIQAISKIRRAGPDFYPYKGDESFADQLNQEVLDVTVLFQVCDKLGCFKEMSDDEVRSRMSKKLERLKEWSMILS